MCSQNKREGQTQPEQPSPIEYEKKPRGGRLLLADFHPKSYRKFLKNSNILRSRSLRASHGDFHRYLYEAAMFQVLE